MWSMLYEQVTVTVDISSHRDVVELNGRKAVLELVDTPGFCGQGVIIEQVKRDLKTKFKLIDKAVIVIAKDGLELAEKNEIRTVLQFLDYKNNPEKLMIVMNDRREKGITPQQKQNDLSNVLHMLGVEDYSIMQPNTQMPPLLPAVSLSNDEEGIFHSEIEMIQKFLLKETTTQDPIIQSDVMTTRKVFSAQSMTLPVLAAALVFGFLLNSYMDASVGNYIEKLKTKNTKLEEEAVSLKAQIVRLETEVFMEMDSFEEGLVIVKLGKHLYNIVPGFITVSNMTMHLKIIRAGDVQWKNNNIFELNQHIFSKVIISKKSQFLPIQSRVFT